MHTFCTESGHADTEPAYLCSKITPQSAAGLAMILNILNDVGTHRAFNFSVGFGGKKVMQGQRRQKYAIC